MRSPTALAHGGKFGGRDEGPGVCGGVDHRRDDSLGSEIERAADHRKIADRDAHDRRRTALVYGRDAREDRRRIPEAVLQIQNDRGKSAAPDEFGNNRIGQAAPAGIYRVALVQHARERKVRRCGHCSIGNRRSPNCEEVAGAAGHSDLICAMAVVINSSMVRRI